MIPWVPIPKHLTSDLPINRPYTRLEAAFSAACDINNGKPGTLRGYAKLWQWSHPKVSRFLKEIDMLNQVIKTNPLSDPNAFHLRSNDDPLEANKLNNLQPDAFHLRSTDDPKAFHTIKKEKETTITPSNKRPPTGDHQTFITWWTYAFERTQGKPYLITGKDFKPVKDLLSTYGIKPLVIMGCWFLTCQDSWIAARRDIAMFKSQINRIPGPKNTAEHNAHGYRSAGILPPENIKFEDWTFWQTEEAQEAATQ